VVFTEVALDAAPQATVASCMALPAGKHLSGLLPADLHRDVSATFAERGVPMSSLENHEAMGG
jgi:hypothetical protein